jgi:hypothetical protein
MNSRLALRPDLDECLLEDRTLLYAGVGLYASQFLSTTGFTPSFIVSGFQSPNSGPSAGNPIGPGPQWFYLQIGVNTTSNGGVRAGGSITIFQPPQVLPAPPGSGVGSGANDGSAPATGGLSAANGFGGTISSGYNTSLNSSNNFGMNPTAVGSVTAHVSGASDQLVEAQSPNGTMTATNQDTGNTPPIVPPPPNPMTGPLSPQDRLLGKGLGSSNSLLIGPGLGNRLSPGPLP